MASGGVVTSVRIAAVADLPAVLDLHRRAGLAGAALDLADARRVLLRMAPAEGDGLYVATAGDRVVGTFALLVMHKLGHGGAPAAVVDDVAVDPDWQGRGVGRAMMTHAMCLCARLGCYKLMLSSNLGRSGAHAFYEALGFARHGVSFEVEFAGRRR